MWHPVTPFVWRRSYSFWNRSLRSAWPSARPRPKCVHLPAERRGRPASWRYSKTASTLSTTSLAKHISILMQIGSSLPRILPLPTLHRLWRIIKHSVRNDGAASGSLDEPLGFFLFCIYSMTLFLFRAFGMVTLEVRFRFMPSSFWAYLVSKAHTSASSPAFWKGR